MDLFKSSDFTDRVNKLIEQWHVPGLAIAVVQDDTFASNGYGNATLSPEKPVTADTLFDIASSSKSLTAASVGLLVADDHHYPQVQWDSIMSELLPGDFVISRDSYTDNVTIEDILSHRTGLPGHDLSYLSPRAAHPDTPKSITRNLRNLEIAAPIRSKYMYNNTMFTVATYLVEQMTGLQFNDFLLKHFFGPLGMSSTNLLPNSSIAAGLQERMAVPYKWHENDTHTPVMFQQCPEALGAGSIITSVNNYIRWVKAMMNQEHPVSKKIYQGLIKPRSVENPDDDVDALDPRTSTILYGAGLEVYYYRGYKVVGHDGSIAGFGSTHFFLPEVKFGGVIFGNSAPATDLANVISRELIDEAIKVPLAERPDRNALQRQRVDKEESERKKKNRERRDTLCTNSNGTQQPQRIPLTAYTGQYWNTGYHGMTVEIRDDKLFVDATDRSMGFTLTFEHLCDQTMYIAHLSDYYEGGDEEFAAEFQFENDKVVKIGIDLEEDLDGRIWFDKVEK